LFNNVGIFDHNNKDHDLQGLEGMITHSNNFQINGHKGATLLNTEIITDHNIIDFITQISDNVYF